jgi:hypothetical protein
MSKKKKKLRKKLRKLEKTKELIREIIRASVPKYISCHDCGLVFATKKGFDEHQKETGHHNPTLSELLLEGIDKIYRKGATTPRRQYFKEENKQEEQE